MIGKMSLGFLTIAFTFATAQAEVKAPTLSGELQCVIASENIDNSQPSESYNMVVQLIDGVGQLSVSQNGELLTAFSISGEKSSRSGYGIGFFVPGIRFLKNPSLDVQDLFIALTLSAELQQNTFVFDSTSSSHTTIIVMDHGQRVTVSGSTSCQGQLTVN